MSPDSGIAMQCNVLKTVFVCVDALCVTNFPLEIWLLCAMIAFLCITGMLYTLAKTFRTERDVHDLRVRVADLRTRYVTRLAEEEIIEVDAVDDAPGTMLPPAQRVAA